MLFVKADIGDYLVDALVDSGASFNFISSALAQKLGRVYVPNGKVTVRLADGSTIAS